MCRRIAGVLLFLVFLASAGAGFVAYRIFAPTRSASPSSAASPTPTAAEQRSAEQTVERLRDQVTSPPTIGDAHSPSPSSEQNARGPVELHVTQREANDLLAGLPQVRKTLADQKLSVPEISFQPDRIVASAQVPVYRGLRARVSAVGRVWAENVRLAYETEDVYVGDLPAPSRVRKELDRSLRNAVRQLNRNIDGKLEEVRIADGELVLRVRS